MGRSSGAKLQIRGRSCLGEVLGGEVQVVLVGGAVVGEGGVPVIAGVRGRNRRK